MNSKAAQLREWDRDCPSVRTVCTLVRPEDVARTVAFFASEDSGFTTGHCIPVNGGAEMD